MKTETIFIINTWKKYRLRIFIGTSLLIIFWIWYCRDPDEIGRMSHGWSMDGLDAPLSRKSVNMPECHKPIVRTSSGEAECRRVLEKLFHPHNFINARPLRNGVTNKDLELDCWCDELKLAVEYNGKQHYEYIPYMHKNNKAEFRNQQYRDYMKIQQCKDNGITLITVPYTIPVCDIESFLKSNLIDLGFIKTEEY